MDRHRPIGRRAGDQLKRQRIADIDVRAGQQRTQDRSVLGPGRRLERGRDSGRVIGAVDSDIQRVRDAQCAVGHAEVDGERILARGREAVELGQADSGEREGRAGEHEVRAVDQRQAIGRGDGGIEAGHNQQVSVGVGGTGQQVQREGSVLAGRRGQRPGDHRSLVVGTYGRQHVDGEGVGDAEAARILSFDENVDRAGEARQWCACDDTTGDAAGSVRSGSKGEPDCLERRPVGQRRRVDQVGRRGRIVGEGGDERQEQRHRLVLLCRGVEQPGFRDLRDHGRSMVDRRIGNQDPGWSRKYRLLDSQSVGEARHDTEREADVEIGRRKRRTRGTCNVDPLRRAPRSRHDLVLPLEVEIFQRDVDATRTECAWDEHTVDAYALEVVDGGRG